VTTIVHVPDCCHEISLAFFSLAFWHAFAALRWLCPTHRLDHVRSGALGMLLLSVLFRFVLPHSLLKGFRDCTLGSWAQQLSRCTGWLSRHMRTYHDRMIE
jgi:hypothetical protein